MSDYSVTTDFSVKDALNSGDPNKLIKGSDIDVEFDAIAVAVATKSNKVSSPTLHNLAKLTAAGDLAEATSIKDDGTDVSVATGRNLKLVDNGALYIAGTQVTSTAAELNILDGVTSSAAELNLLTGKTGTVWTSTNDGAGSGLDADLLDGVQGANFYRSDQADTAHSFTTSSATGGNQGADSVNAGDFYKDGVLTSGTITSGYDIGHTTALKDDVTKASYNIATSQTKATWESVGPTGSGATNIATMLDVVPTGATHLIVMSYMQLQDTSAGTGISSTRAREYGSSATSSVHTGLHIWYGKIDGGVTYVSQIPDATIPLDGSNRFEAYWDTNVDTVMEHLFYLKGWVE